MTLRRGERVLATRFASGAGLVALFGPSGAGKTSVIEMIAGLVRPDRGRIVVLGRVLFDSEQAIDLPPEARACGYIPQDGLLFPHLDVRANLLFGSKRDANGERAMPLEEAVGFLGIGGLLDRLPRTLSGGEARRVAIGRALLSGPDVLLMDEPLSSLDMARREEILQLIARTHERFGIPVLYVSHDRAEIDRLGCEIIPVG